jgi:hypothetical protein
MIKQKLVSSANNSSNIQFSIMIKTALNWDTKAIHSTHRIINEIHNILFPNKSESSAAQEREPKDAGAILLHELVPLA